MLKDKVTYLISAHTDPDQFLRLVSVMDNSAYFVVHIDAKTDIEPFLSARRANLTFVEDRVRVNWSGWSGVEADKRLIHAAIAAGYDQMSSHFVLLSGTCYPIKPVVSIVEHFTSNPGKEFIKFIDVADSPEHYLRSVVKYHFLDSIPRQSGLKGKIFAGLRKLTRTAPISKHLPPQTVFAFGSAFWAMTPSCLKFILTENHLSRRVERICRTAMCPDEIYFHTMLANSPFVYNSTGRQKFEGRGTYKLANFHAIDPSLDRWFDVSDYERIVASDKLFVRKVRSVTSGELLNMIDDLIGNG